MKELKEEMPNNTVKEKKDIYIYENEPKKEMKQTNRNLLSKYVENKQDMKNKSCIFETRKYSRLEKKIFNELDYEDFLKNNRTISDKLYKKIMRKKCGKRFSLPLLLLSVLLVSLILDLSWGFGLVRGLYEFIIIKKLKNLKKLSSEKDKMYIEEHVSFHNNSNHHELIFTICIVICLLNRP
ncbi:Plasmodium exported protein (Pm-fam-a like), unknown function [Plasmodium malariae]|uniref:Fam-l protein n=1 Tax=Plasmodium malariae TaxID=5858 RepID=A0A1A8WQW8_PLAMA|nr:Plasmodium exported protein (Pm-fam-a like), unknown function [Plasmodium malariae]